MDRMLAFSPIFCLFIGGACFRLYCFVVLATFNVISWEWRILPSVCIENVDRLNAK